MERTVSDQSGYIKGEEHNKYKKHREQIIPISPRKKWINTNGVHYFPNRKPIYLSPKRGKPI